MINVIVSIANTNVWIAPENRSKYICKNAGIPSCASHGSNPYHNAIMIVPAIIFPNKRRDMESGVANYPIRLIGNKIGIGLKRSVNTCNLLVLNALY